MSRTLVLLLTLIATCCFFAFAAPAAAASAQATEAPAPSADDDKPPMTQEELDQMLAPLALYPDSLLSQVLMASTYPIEVVQADRWVKANKGLKGDQLATALEKEDWDPSVKSLVGFPDILAMMSDKLDMTVKIGDAFLDQQKQVMDTIQKLRAKANDQGNLKSNEQQTVKVEPASGGTQTIIIEPTNPQVIYVPQYNPTVVYGTWPYPSYPPYPYYPPGYVASSVVSFGVGLAVGAAWGYAWGNCNWGRGDVNVNVNQNTNFNKNIDRSKYQNQINNRGGQGGQGKWQHDGAHRQGAPYRDSKAASKYGGKSASQASQARDSYRGRAESGRQDIARGGADNFKGSGAGSNRPSSGPSSSNRASSGPSSSKKSGALGASSQNGASAKQSSDRGNSSRQASGGSSSRSNFSGGGGGGRSGSSGASRGGGGGSRGGGGRGGGGRR